MFSQCVYSWASSKWIDSTLQSYAWECLQQTCKMFIANFEKLFLKILYFSFSHVHVVVKTDRGDRSCTDTEDVRPGEWKGKGQ